MSGYEGSSLAARAEHWARRLTAIPSVTGSPDEARFAEAFAALLRQDAACGGAGMKVWQVAVPGGAHPRSAVLALLRGKGRRTVMLTGHFDTVEIECYGALRTAALDPDRLAQELPAALRGEAADARTRQAISDLAGGEYIAGRGLLDMKAGLAAGIAAMEHAAGEKDRSGNLLFVAVPDEEGNSAGARCVAAMRGALEEELGLSLEAAINLDSIADDGDGTAGQVVALGTIGKLLPSALVVGQPVHAAYALRGLGAPALAGALAAALEWLPKLTPRSGEELGSPPTLLGMRDGKPGYDVTTPHSVWMFWNIALHRDSPADVLHTLETEARSTVARLVSELAERRAAIDPAAGPLPPVEVLTFDKLLREAKAARPRLGEALRELATDLAQDGHDVPEQCRQLTEFVWRESGRPGPAVVLGFASTPYLPVELRDDPAAQRLARAVREAAAMVGARFGTPIGTVQFFPGISDMSFLGQAGTGGVDAIARNTPAWDSAVRWPEQGALAGIPIVNAGPWGRDYHTRLERAHRRYTFEVLPVLVEEIARRVLAEDTA